MHRLQTVVQSPSKQAEEEVMDQVIHPVQTYCEPGKSNVGNVSLIQDLLEASGSLGMDADLVSLDRG